MTYLYISMSVNVTLIVTCVIALVNLSSFALVPHV